ncbi:hypothetical protein LQF12_08945 [Ruania suaedae]|uniref:hypothetical protein n=1 Tax=Ruania suaedae TaxID=2897774 RepID=UPI001E2E984F|nr:hypothetical protein [Ruania suaedae]UFU01654.1 hypothetical protein LQF12_08945 [Ruania suaedae]
MSIVIAVLVGAALLLAIWGVVRAVRDQAVILRQLLAGAVLELGIVVQMVVAAVLTARGHVVDGVLLWGYLVTTALLLPAAAVVAVAERSRWSSVVLVAACVTMMVLQLRVHQIWVSGGGG